MVWRNRRQFLELHAAQHADDAHSSSAIFSGNLGPNTQDAPLEVGVGEIDVQGTGTDV